MKNRYNVSDARLRFLSTKLAAAIVRGALTIAVLSALLLTAATPARAQTEKVLHSFGVQAGDGVGPESRLTADAAGNLYGTTANGGVVVYGTVFELSRNHDGGWDETVLYTFTGGADGAEPDLSHVIFDNAGNIYGTTFAGGAYGLGVVFELSPTGTGWTETVLHSFGGYAGDGVKPINGLIMDSARNLYGTTAFGGSGANGTVFELSPSDGGWTEQVIYNVQSTGSGLTMDAAGNIFGTSVTTVFELLPNGIGGWNPAVIYTFAGARAKHYIYPNGTLALDQAGNLYGTTFDGGAKNNGSVYRLSRGGKKWTKKNLYSFKGYPNDGSNPDAGIVLDAAGNIYGTTYLGGIYGPGTVFELVRNKKGGYKERILWSFNGTDGNQPFGSPILDSAGNLYGTTFYGGSVDAGAVFEVTP